MPKSPTQTNRPQEKNNAKNELNKLRTTKDSILKG